MDGIKTQLVYDKVNLEEVMKSPNETSLQLEFSVVKSRRLDVRICHALPVLLRIIRNTNHPGSPIELWK